MNAYFRDSILQTKAYTLKKYRHKIKLNQNEFPLDLSPALKKKVLAALKKLPLNRYPEYEPFALKNKLAKRLKISPEQLLITNGSNVLVQAMVAACAFRGKVMVVEPTFSVYEIEAKLFENQVIKVPLSPQDFSLDETQFLSQLETEKPNLVFLANPNAPTGNPFTQAFLFKVLQSASGLVVIDEAYAEFSGETLLPWVKQYPNLVILRTFSKACGLGGVRVGYLVAQESITSQVVKALMPYCLSAISACIAEIALDYPMIVKRNIREVIQERKRVFAAMQQIHKVKVFPSQTNFLLFKVKDTHGTFAKLVKKGILVREISSETLSHCLRVTIGTKRENDQFIKTLNSILTI